ncbi:MAG: hypothetical protein SGPRY_011508, partial [Prymnesium sp.]
MDQSGVVCYERAAGRVQRERSGMADSSFMEGVIRLEVLPTAVASRSDHYVVIDPHRGPRFMTVDEVARGFDVPTSSPLY